LIAEYFGANSVGEYSLVKRVIGLFQPFLFLGLGVGLVRYLALTNDRTKRQSYLQASGCVVFFLTTIFVVFINIFKKEFSAAIFGAIEYESLVFPFSMLLAGLVLHMFAYAYFRGILKVKVFNVLQVVNLVLTPIVAIVIWRSKNIEMLVFTTGALTFVVAAVFFFNPLRDLIRPVSGTIRSLKELMSYSMPRLGGDLVLAGIFSLGPIFAAHVIAIKEVGYLSVGQSLLSSACALLAPLGLVLLPRVSNMMAEGKEEIIKKKIGLLAEAII
jgi:O-antigen/teichoic acid export membrane protein